MKQPYNLETKNCVFIGFLHDLPESRHHFHFNLIEMHLILSYFTNKTQFHSFLSIETVN